MIGGFRAFLVLVLSVLALGHPPDSTDFKKSDSLIDKAFPKNVDTKQKEDILRAFESSLLNLFGLRNRPQPNRNIKIPPYMLDLYKTHTKNPGSLTRNFNLKGKSVGTANTVRSFFHEGTDVSLEHINGCGAENCLQLWFNVTSIPEEEVLNAAELRLFIQGNENSDSRKKQKLRHRMEVHEIIKPKNSKSEDSFTRLLDIKHISVKNGSWESLDIHPAVLKWRKTPHLNHGLEVRILPYNSHPSKTPIKHVRLRRSAVGEENHSKKHILVTYTDDLRGHRTKRSRKSKKRKRPRKNRTNKRKKYKTECRRRPLYVDFTAVGWNDWIVAPSGYNAYYCHGDCHFPFPEHMNVTNHAIVQDLVNSIDPRSVPKPCCVPTDLSPISLLYIDEYDRVILKNYQDMVVEGCGCR